MVFGEITELKRDRVKFCNTDDLWRRLWSLNQRASDNAKQHRQIVDNINIIYSILNKRRDNGN